MDEEKFNRCCDFLGELIKAKNSKTREAILKKNCFLIDKELFQAIDFVVKKLFENGYSYQAEWLLNFAQKLQEKLNNIQQLNQKAVELYQNGQNTKSVTQFKSALEIARSIWLDDNPDVADSISRLGYVLQAQEKYLDAEIYFRDALAMRQRLFREDHLDVASSINNLGHCIQAQGRFKEAEPYYRDALAMKQRLLGENHPDVPASINNLGYLLQAQGRYREAEPYYRDALAMKQRLLGKNHPDVAISFGFLGHLLQMQGKYTEAEKLFKKSLTIIQKFFARDHPEIATCLNNLGYLLQTQGKYTEAESYYQDALAMRQRLFGEDHSHIAISLNNLGYLLQTKGRYIEAELYHRDAMEMFQRLFQGDYPDVATCLNNLGHLLEAQRRYTEAEPYYRDAMEMFQKLFQGDHLNVANSLNNLGMLLSKQGKHTEAESYLRDALTMKQRLFGGDHADIANSLNNLGTLLIEQGKYTEAKSLFYSALVMSQKCLRGDHPDVANRLNNLGYLLEEQGKCQEAESYYQDALAMKQRLFGSEHPDIVYSLTNLSLLLTAQSKLPEALIKCLEAVEVENNLTSSVFAFSSELDRLNYLDLIKNTADILLSLIVTHFSKKTQAIQNSFDTILQRKSISAAAIAAFNSVIYEERYQNLKEQLQHLRSLGEQIFHLTFNLNKPEDRERLAQLKQEADRLEKYLSSQVSEIQLQDQTVNRQTVAEQLPEGSALLEFVSFKPYDFDDKHWNSACYLVFILLAEQPDKVEMKILGEAKEIEELIELSRLLNITYQSSADGQLVRFDGKELVIDPSKFAQIPVQVKPESIPHYQYVTDAAIKLRKKIFDPIEEYLQGYQQIFISPDASLNLVPFGILPLDETGEELLGDRYQISYLSAGRDLFRSTVSTNRPASEPLVIADPKFLLDESDSNAISQNQNSDRNSPITLDSQLISVLDEEHLSRAETTGLLAEKVAAMLGVEPHLQADALVSYLKSDRCPRILLIGTHGLYCPLSEAQQNAIAHQDRDRLSAIPQVSNPMIRSGLAFAGASNWQKNLPLPPEAGNGYLMAQDVAQLDLWANEITVLLACNSAVGDVHQGEGVFGLRRAFAVAGAKTLIMSLWSVPEKASALLMERFFNNLKQKTGRNAALQEAQNYIRFITVEQLRQSDLGLEVLKELTGNRNFASETPVEDENCQPLKHPFYWGAWICQGETTPFDI